MMAEQATQLGWFDKIKAQFSQFSFSSSWMFEVLGYLVGGFILGFLIKHFGRYVFWIALATVVSLLLLEFLGVIAIHYTFVREFFGVASDATLSQAFNGVLDWVKNHIAQTISALLGLYLAWELA